MQFFGRPMTKAGITNTIEHDGERKTAPPIQLYVVWEKQLYYVFFLQTNRVNKNNSKRYITVFSIIQQRCYFGVKCLAWGHVDMYYAQVWDQTIYLRLTGLPPEYIAGRGGQTCKLHNCNNQSNRHAYTTTWSLAKPHQHHHRSSWQLLLL